MASVQAGSGSHVIGPGCLPLGFFPVVGPYTDADEVHAHQRSEVVHQHRTTTDDILAHFGAHFTDKGGNPYFGFDWWWDGTNDVQGVAGWAQEDVDGGGGFYSTLNIDDYRRWTSMDSTALSTLDTWMHDGFGTTISILGDMSHAITAWGFEYDSSIYPTRTPIYGNSKAPSHPYYPSLQNPAIEDKNQKEIIEFPILTRKMGLLKIPAGGGFFLRLFGVGFTLRAVRHMNKIGYPAMLYVHPWELYDTQKCPKDKRP